MKEDTNHSESLLHETFKKLIDLQVKYNNEISKQYLENISEGITINIENYLRYSNRHCKDNNGEKNIFHIVLSVKVSNESTLVPFSSIYDEKGVVPDEDRGNLFNLGQEKIKLDFATFLSDNVRKLNNDNEVSCCSFKVSRESIDGKNKYKIEDFKYLPKFPDENNWLQALSPNNSDQTKETEQLTKEKTKKLQEVLFDNEKEKTSFVQVFSDYYQKKGFDTLYYTFYNMDYDCRYTADSLTRLMIISSKPEEPSEFLLCQLNKIRDIASLVRSRYIFDLVRKNQYEAIKAAKAAIMSRNLSHNLGSHVMFYIKQKLESVHKILQTGALENLIRCQSLDELKVVVDGSGDELPFLVGLGRFLNYLQERQDFIATVATDHIPYSTIINFKDAIYDELKPEKRFLRHEGPESKGKKPANLLLDYIAYSEGFTSSDKIEILFAKDRKDETEVIEYFDGSGKPEDVPNNLREFNIAIPGGNMGRQAFFSIMENIIRNTAKHDGTFAENGTLQFLLEKLTGENICKVCGYSWRQGESEKNNNDTCDLSECFKQSQNSLEYLGITVKLNRNVSDNLDGIIKGLHQKYLTNGLMDEECKGLKEIRISAAWMRGYKLDDEIPDKEPPAVTIRITDKGHLQYIICLPKPKRVAFIHPTEKISGTFNKRNRTDLDKYGCQVFDFWNFDFDKKQIADFDLIVCSKNDYNSIQKHVGSRILIKEIAPLIKEYDEAKDANSKELFRDNLYLQWLEQSFPEETNIKLSICDKKAEDGNITTSESVSKNIIHCSSSSTTDEQYYNDRILFSTHYPGQAEVIKKDKDCGLFPNARFVEAISGGDSTDRLIRHDKRDAEWYCRHKAAGLTQVAIFDERIYSMVMPNDNLGIKKAVKKFLQDNPNSTAKQFVYNIKFNNGDKLNDTQKRKVYDSLTNQDINENNCIKSLSFLAPDYTKVWQYREKGIWIFDIHVSDFSHEDKNQKHIEIIGYNAPPTRSRIGRYSEDFKETTIANIKWVEDEVKVVRSLDDDNLNENFEFKNKFDFISIHQGLLDKIYGALGIEKQEFEKKNMVTQALFDAFSHKKTIIENGCEYVNEAKDSNGDESFLPQFIIHSGRSKPNKEDMPQHLPFVQFSAIDHAVRDCKHTLTELLYSAHYGE